MTRTLAPIAAALMAMGFAGPAMAAPCMTMTISPSAPGLAQWNPLDGQDQEVAFTATITRDAASTKSVRLIFIDNDSNISPTRIGTSGPRYAIVSAGGGVISFPKGTTLSNSYGVTVPFTNKNDATVSLKVRILGSREDFTSDVRYQENLDYAAQCLKANGSDNGSSTVPTSSNLRLDLTIPKVLSVTTSSAAEINFQEFTKDQEQTIIRLASTSPLNVSATTDNNGKLMIGTSAPPNATIPYTMQFGLNNGSPLAPLPSTGTPITAARAGVGGSAYALNLKLTDGVPSGKIAGAYSDTITLTITPQ